MTTPPPAERRTPGGTVDADVDWDAEEEAAEAARRAAPRDRRWWLFGGAAILVMLGLAVWWGLSATLGRVHWVDTGFQVVSEEEVQVRLDLRRDPTREVICRIEAQDTSHMVVGRAEPRIGPTPDSPSRHVVSVRTAAEATTGYVDECWYVGDQPRH